jgi:hypothetical protein
MIWNTDTVRSQSEAVKVVRMWIAESRRGAA